MDIIMIQVSNLSYDRTGLIHLINQLKKLK